MTRGVRRAGGVGVVLAGLLAGCAQQEISRSDPVYRSPMGKRTSLPGSGTKGATADQQKKPLPKVAGDPVKK